MFLAMIYCLYNKNIFESGGGNVSNGADIIKDYISELSRIQNWMIAIKSSNLDVYNSMHDRYLELKVTLTSLGVNLAEIDKIKE